MENPCTFLLAKEKTWKRIFNINSQLSQNRREKQIMPFKTTVNWLFNDIYCYLVISCFDWKIGVFQQTVVRVYRILKGRDYSQKKMEGDYLKSTCASRKFGASLIPHLCSTLCKERYVCILAVPAYSLQFY